MTLHASHNIVTPTDIVIPTGDSLSDKEEDRSGGTLCSR